MSTSNQNTTYVAESKDSEFDQGSASRNNMTDITNPFVVNAKRVKKSKVDKTSYIAKPMKKKPKRLPVISGSTTPKELVYSTPLATAIEKKQLADHKPEIKRMSTTRLISPAELTPQEALDIAESTTVKRTNMRLTPLNSQLAGKAAESLVRKKKTSKWVEESQPVINRVQQPYIPLPAQQPSNWKSKFAMQKKNIEEKKALIEKEKVREASTRFHIIHSAIRTQDAEVTERLKNFKIDEPEYDVETPNVPMMWQGTRNSILYPPPDSMERHITKSHDENREISNQMNLQFSPPAIVYKFLLSNHILEAFRNSRMQTKLQQVNKARVDYNIFIVLDEGWLTVFKDYLPTAILAMTGAGYYYFTKSGYFPVHKNLPAVGAVVAKCQENVGYQAAYRAFFFKDYASMKEISVTAEQVFKDLALFEDQKTKAYQRAKFFKKMQPHAGVVKDVKDGVEAVRQGMKAVADVKTAVEGVVDTLSYNGYKHESIIELVLARFEDFMLAYVGFTNSANFVGAAAVIGAYVKSLGFNGSITHALILAMKRLFTVSAGGDILSPEASEPEVDQKAGTMFDSVIRLAKGALSKWKEVKHSQFISKMLGIIALVFTFTIVPKAWLSEGDEKHGVLGYLAEIISKKMKDIASGSDSVVETICEGVIYVVERIYSAIVSGDISMLIYDDNSLYEIDKEYALLVAVKHMVFTEALQKHPCTPAFIDDKDYLLRVSKCVDRLEKLRKLESFNIRKNKAMYDTLQMKVQALRNIEAMISQQIRQSCVKEKPFAVLIAGPSGIGKSYLMTYLYKTICHANNIPCSTEQVVTLNDTDQYDTEYKPHHNVVIMDDVANAKAETYKTTTPIDKIIKIINNVPMACVKAAVEEKGQVYYNPKVVMVTTNKLDLMAQQFSNEPVSVLRRFDAILEVKLKSGSTDVKTGLLNPDAIHPEILPDAWEIRLSRVVPIRQKSGPDQVMHLSSKLQNSMTFFDAAEVIKRRSVKHFIREKRIVAETTAMVNGVRCKHSHAVGVCPICRRLKSEHDPIYDSDPDVKSKPADCDSSDCSSSSSDSTLTCAKQSVTAEEEAIYALLDEEVCSALPTFRYKVIDKDKGSVEITEENGVTRIYHAFTDMYYDTSDAEKEEMIANFFDNYKALHSGRGCPTADQLAPEVGIFSNFFSKSRGEQATPKTVVPKVISTKKQYFCMDNEQYEFRNGNWQYRKSVDDDAITLQGLDETSVLTNTPAWARGVEESLAAELEEKKKAATAADAAPQEESNVPKRWGMFSFLSNCVRYEGLYKALHTLPADEDDVEEKASISLQSLQKSRTSSNLVAVLAVAGLSYATYKTMVSLYKRYNDATMLAVMWERSNPEFWSIDGEVPTPVTARDGAFKLVPVTKHEPSATAATSSPENLITLLESHSGVLYFKYKTAENLVKTGFCNAYPLKENFWLCPLHAFEECAHLMGYTLRKGQGKSVSGSRSGLFDKTMIHPLPEHDAAVVCLANAGSVRPLLEFVAEISPSFMRGVKFTKRYNEEDGVTVHKCIVTSQNLYKMSMPKQKYTGYFYSLSEASLPGDCMSPIILEGTASVVGFHLSGNSLKADTHAGGGVTISRSLLTQEIDKFSAFLNEAKGISAHSGTAFPAPTYDKPDSVEGVLPLRHVVREIPADLDSTVEYLGCHGQGCVSFRTQIRTYDEPERIAELFPGFPQKHFPPTGVFMRSEGIKTHDIWRKDLELIGSNNVHFNPDIMFLAMDDMRSTYRKVFNTLSVDLLSQTAPYTLDVAVNGSDGVAGLSRLDLSTSAGWHWAKPKTKLVEILEPTPQISYRAKFCPEVEREVERLRSELSDKRRVNTIFRATIKDEPLKKGKGKMRIFAACDVAFSILVRQYFCPLVRVLYEHWIDFEMAVGINAYGPEWNAMYERLAEHGHDRFIAGDYSNYDKTMPGELISLAFSQLVYLARLTGNYSKEDITVMQGIASEVANPVYEYDGCFIRVGGSNPSGNPLTVIINCIANSILNRYVFKSLYPEYDFCTHVVLFTYGDDDAKTSSVHVPEFNYKNFQLILKECGMVWTDNSKSKEQVRRLYDHMNPYYTDQFDIDDPTHPEESRIGFLKRGFRHHEELNRVVAPLERASMSKMLYVYRCKTASKSQQMVTHIQSLQTFLRECFLHGRSMYEDARVAILQLTNERNYPVCLDDFPTYEVCLEKFDTYTHRNYNHAFLVIREDEKVRIEYEISLLTPQDDHGNDHAEDVADLPCEQRKSLQQECAIQNFPEPRCSGEEIPYITEHHFGNYKNLKSCNTQSYRAPLSELSALRPEAGGMEPTMNFCDLLSVTTDIGHSLDNTATASSDPLDLNNFLSRPIKLYDFTWAPGTTFVEGFNPWTSFFTNPRVINRITNFKLCRGNMHVKFVVNGSKFHYGRVLTYYTPLHQSYVGTDIVSNLSMPIRSIMRASQQPCVYLDPSTNQGAEIVLPFFFPKDAFNITTGDWDTMGLLQMNDIAPLKVVGGLSSTAVSVAVYGWMENVVLDVPTSVASTALTPQSGDEYSEGVISKPASVLSNLAGKLANAPVIGPYARATQLAAGATAEIAKAFGYSRPTLIDQPSIMKPAAVGQLATTNTHDTSLKLTVDSKQELTIDPRTAGAPIEDDLTITEWCKKECIISQVQWSSTDAVGQMLIAINVTPKIYYTTPLDAFNKSVHTTPSGYISSLFQFWRGEMCYRVSVVRSAFHVGRLRLVYDPVIVANTLVNDNTYDNVQYSWILDLQEANEAEMQCQWAAETNYLRVHGSSDPYEEGGEPVDPATYNSTTCNGQFAVYVETTLVTPNSVTDDPVTIFIYAHEENAEFACPYDGTFSMYSHGLLAPESGLMPEAGDESDLVLENTVAETHNVASAVNLRDNALSVHFGEKISSLRQLLKRYTLSSREYQAVTPSGSTISEVILVRHNFPSYAGAFPWLSGITPNSQTYAVSTLLNWIAPCYGGWRGAVRHKYSMTGVNNALSENYLMVANAPDGPETVLVSDTYYGDTPKLTRENRSAGFSGAALTQYGMNGTLEFETPFYSNARFSYGKCLDTQRKSTDRTELPLIARYTPTWYMLNTRTSTTRHMSLDHYVAAGEDMAFFMFINTPILYKNVYI